MPPFLSAGTFSASLHIPRSGGLEYELQIKHQTDLDKKKQQNKNNNNKKNTTILFSVQVQLRIQEAFGKSCACCASPFLPFKQELGIKRKPNYLLGILHSFCLKKAYSLSAHEKMLGETYCDKFLSRARELSLKTRTTLLPNVKLVVNSIRSLICIIERSIITFTSNGKREFVSRDQVSPSLVVYCLLFLHTNQQLHAVFYP